MLKRKLENPLSFSAACPERWLRERLALMIANFLFKIPKSNVSPKVMDEREKIPHGSDELISFLQPVLIFVIIYKTNSRQIKLQSTFTSSRYSL